VSAAASAAREDAVRAAALRIDIARRTVEQFTQ
jgi:hypothetical protein